MLKLEYLKQLLIIASVLSVFTCAIVQKIKQFFRKSKYICIYSLIINISFSIVFCITFTDITFPNSLWIGFFSFLGADTIYKSLENKLLSYKDLVNTDTISVKKENIINTDGDN